MKRITKLQQLMEHALIASKRSHDAETKVGSVLVDGDRHTALASACNGFIHGARDKDLPNTRPSKYKYMCHSEENLISSCARRGQKTEGNYIVCTLSPCVRCMRLIYQSGITKVVVKNKYRDFEDLKKMLDLDIVEKITQEGYIELNYRPKGPKILVIGSNPSIKSPDSTPFHPDVKSGSKVRSWFKDVHATVEYTNVSHETTPFNRALTKKEIEDELVGLEIEIEDINPSGIITVGDTAKRAIDALGLSHFNMPHPSGLCRFWNSKKNTEAKLLELSDYISKV